MYTAAIITISDKGHAGLREDTAGPLAAKMLEEAGFEVVYNAVIPDETEEIKAELRKCADELDVALALTSGGTGFSPRDVTPEATLAVLHRRAPGIPEAMRMKSLAITDRAMLTRSEAGIRGKTLIINLPGSPKAVGENLSAIIGALEHGVETIRNAPQDHENTGI